MKTKTITLLTTILTLFTLNSFSQQVNIIASNYNPNGCFLQTITFTAMAPPQADNFSWWFGDGQSENTTINVVTHTFTSGGNYWVSLNVFENSNFLGNGNISINIGGQLNLNLTTDSACVGETVGFNLWPQQNNYNWNFGDPASGTNNTSTSSNPDHTFNSQGTYYITLITNTQCGWDTVSRQVYVSNTSNPNADFWHNWQVCPNEDVNFGVNNYYAASFAWTFGDPASGANNTSNLQNPSHNYSTTGTYPVTLTVTNMCGHSKTRTDSIYVISNLTFSQYYNLSIYTDNGSSNFNGCPNEVFRFDVQNQFASYLWSFGDGDSSTEAYPEHSYDTLGTYNLSVTITNGCGNDTTLTQIVTIGSTGTAYLGNPKIYNKVPWQLDWQE